MPRKSKAEQAKAKYEADVAEAIARLPFSPSHAQDSPDRYENLGEYGDRASIRFGVARAVYVAFRLQGKRAGECRRIFAGTDDATDGDGGSSMRGLSGPRRRLVFREFAEEFANGIAPSYVAYGDGEARKGSSHARMHGALAVERMQAEAAALAEAEAAQAKREARNAKAKATREARKAAKAAQVQEAANGADAVQAEA